MSTQVQYRRGTATQNNAFTGALAEITVDTTNQILRVHDGVTAGGYSLVGLTASQTLTNKIYQGTSVSVTGNVAGGNVTTAGIVSATGNITGGNLSGTSIVGTLTTAAQTNITSVGTLGSLSVTGNITGGNLLTSGNIVDTGAFSIITGASGNVNLAPNGTNVLVTTTTGANITGTLNATGNANVGNLGAATVVATTLTGTLSTAAQTNITSVGTLGSLSVTGNTTAGNFVGTLNGSGANVTTISATNISSGTLDQARLANAAVTLGSTALTLGATVTTVAGLTSVTSTTFVGALTGAATSATTAGTVTTAAQPNITSVGTLTSVSITGNVTAGNVNAGNITIAGDLISSLGATLTIDPATSGNAGLVVINGNLQVNGTTTTINSNVVSTNDLTVNYANNAINAAAANGGGIEVGPIGSPFITWLYNSTSNVFTSSGGISAVGNITAGNVSATTFTGALTGAATSATTAGTVTTAAQPNITSVGTLTSVSVSGNITAGNLSGTSIVGTLTTAAQTNITSVGTLTALSVGTGNITGGNLILSGAIIDSAQLDIQTSAANANIVLTPNGTGNVNIGRMSASGNITAVTFIGALSGAATSATTAGTVTTAAQPNITSVGTLTSVSITGNVTAGNLSGTSIVGTLTTAAQTNITSVGTLTALSVTGNVTGGNLSGTSIVGTLTTAAQTNITSVGTLTALSVTGNVTGGNLITAGLVSLSSITKTGSNGVGNIGAAASAFNTVFAKATSAQYADVAEQYQADADYPPGTVLILGGTQEVTASTHSHDSAVAGVVSQKPSYLMNAGLQTANSVPVALLGRVPCQVIGTITRGQLLVTSDIPGTAIALDHNRYVPGCVIGKALENYNSNVPGTIEIAVGSK